MHRPEGERLWRMSVLSVVSRTTTPLPGAPRIVQQRPWLSPDDRWVAYHSNHSGRDEVYVQAFPGGGRQWPVSSGGGTAPVWAHDGKQLFYRRDEAVMAVSIDGAPNLHAGTPRQQFKTELMGPFDVATDGRFLMMEPQKQDVVTELSIVVNWFAELTRLTRASP